MNELIFNGKNFTEFNAYYATSNFLDGAAKDVQSVSVVGRSGDLQLSNNRYKNLSLKIRVYVTRDMEASMRAMRNYLESVHGYARVEISDQPNEYRMAAYKEMFAPDSYDSKVGVVDLTFDSMPQRFLKSGEITTSVSSSSSSVSGNPVSIDNPSGFTALTGLNVDLEPVQDLNGYDHPWVGGAGKNKLPTSTTKTSNGVTFTTNSDGTVTAKRTTASTQNAEYDFTVPSSLYGKQVVLNGCPSGGADNGTYRMFFLVNGSRQATDYGNGASYTIPASPSSCVVRINVFSAFNGTATFKPMVRLSSETDATYEPYSNICPITGHTSATVTRAVDGSSTDYTIDLNGTIYGGTLNVTTGVLTVTHGFVTFDGSSDEGWYLQGDGRRCAINSALPNYKVVEGTSRTIGALSNLFTEANPSNTWNSEIGFSIEANGVLSVRQLATNTMTVAGFKTFLQSNPMQICYPLQTPTTAQLTPQQVSLLTGTNIISTDMESVTVTIANPSELENPTLFESKPIIRVYGNGTLNVNNQYITVTNSPYPYIDIDCELMDCYYGSNNANQYVSFSTTDYVTLRSGTNYFSYSGFTQVQVTPRWFEI